MIFGLRIKILFFFGLLIFISISNFGILLMVEKNASEQQLWVMHTHEVIEKSEAFLGYMRDTETGQRGYLLTIQSNYLEPYNLGIAKARSSFDLLKEMTQDNPLQQSRLDVIQEHMIEKFIELAKTIQLAQQGKMEEAKAIVKNDHGKAIMDHMRQHLEDFKVEEERLLFLRKAQFTDSQNNIRTVFLVEALLLLILIVVIGFYIQRKLVGPLTHLTRSITGMISGEEIKKISSTSSDEVGQLAKAFNNMHQEVHDRTEELKKQAHFDHAFSHVVAACSSSHDLSKALSKALIAHSKYHPSPLSAIYQYNEDTEQLHCVATHGTSDALVETISPNSGLIGQAYRASELMIVSADSVEGFHIETGLASLSPRAIVLQPITLGKKVLGVFVLAYTSDPDKRDRQYLDSLSHQLGVTMVNAQQYKSLQKLTKELEEKSITDPLTGLNNRRYMELQLKELILLSARYGHELTLIILDIDHFKHINDTLGHLAGDEALKAISFLLKQETRASDLVIRYGGEEFIVILPQSSLDEAEGTAEKLRKAVEALDIPALGGESITISLGVAMLGKDEDMNSIISRADKALYRAKEEGRNRVCRDKAS